MRKISFVIATSLVLSGALGVEAAEGWAKSKAAAAAGRLEPGPVPTAPVVLVPNQGADACPGTAFGTLPFNDSGTTVGLTNDMNTTSGAGANCTQWGGQVAGPDVIYTFTPGAGASMTFTVTPGNAVYDSAIYLLTTCGTGSTCVQKMDSTLSGQAEVLGPVSLTQGTPYFFYIDSFYAAGGGACGAGCEAGPYSVAVTGTLPADLIQFSVN